MFSLRSPPPAGQQLIGNGRQDQANLGITKVILGLCFDQGIAIKPVKCMALQLLSDLFDQALGHVLHHHRLLGELGGIFLDQRPGL